MAEPATMHSISVLFAEGTQEGMRPPHEYTVMFALAEMFIDHPQIAVTFLRAQRDEGGARSFLLLPGAPLTTSFGRDLYCQIFGDDAIDQPTKE